jgi:hypothetical protein
MQSRLAIVLMSVAGAGVLFCLGLAFGLGVMSSPPAETHKQIAITTTPTKVARQETTGSATRDDDRALTPLYPTRPAGPASPPAAQAAQAQEPAQQQQQATPQPHQRAQQQAPASAPAAPTPTQQAKTDAPPAAAAKPAATPPVSTPKAATPVSLESRNACDVQACARAYRSFRESDCSYQPYSGPRQLCVSPPGSKEASRSRAPERAARVRDLRDAAPNLREDARDDDATADGRATDRRADDDSRTVVLRYHRDYTADGEDDRVVVPADSDRGDWADDPGDTSDDDQ